MIVRPPHEGSFHHQRAADCGGYPVSAKLSDASGRLREYHFLIVSCSRMIFLHFRKTSGESLSVPPHLFNTPPSTTLSPSVVSSLRRQFPGRSLRERVRTFISALSNNNIITKKQHRTHTSLSLSISLSLSLYIYIYIYIYNNKTYLNAEV